MSKKVKHSSKGWAEGLSGRKMQVDEKPLREAVREFIGKKKLTNSQVKKTEEIIENIKKEK